MKYSFIMINLNENANQAAKNLQLYQTLDK